jgi:hypothetical protein
MLDSLRGAAKDRFDRLELVARHRRDKELMRTAFAGDGVQKALVRAAVRALRIDAIVETGTYIGKTSMWLGATFRHCDVYTSEVDPAVYEGARLALSRLRNVHPYLADSAPWIAGLCAGELRGRATLFFLDAHGMSRDWRCEHPLLAELRSIRAREDPSIVIIDDFKVPGRPDYAFLVDETDTSVGFPEAQRMSLAGGLDMDLIADVVDESDAVLYPAYNYDDALRYQSDPAFAFLIGYVVLAHRCPAARLDPLLSSRLVTRHYRRER